MNYFENIKNICNRKAIYVWGAGATGSEMYCNLKFAGILVDYFIDRNAENKKDKMGVPIISPQEFFEKDDEDKVIHIAVGNKQDKEEIIGSLIEKGYDKYIEDLFKGKFADMNIVDGLLGYSRDMTKQGIMKYTNKTHEVIILGDSSTGEGLFGLKSWVEMLSELTDENDKFENISIVNAGIVGYSSNEQVLKLIRDLLKKGTKVIISLSGWNDVKRTLTSSCSFNSSYIDHILEKNENHKKSLNDNYIKKKIGGAEEEDKKINASNKWEQNMRLMYSICKEFGIIFIGCLQPNGITSKEEDMINSYFNSELTLKMKLELEKMKAICKKHEYLYDLSEIFKDKNALVDIVHANVNGNAILANKIYNVINAIDFSTYQNE